MKTLPIILHTAIATKRLGLLLVALLFGFTFVVAQSTPDRRSRQQLQGQDTSTVADAPISVLPDSIVLETYNPTFPGRRGLIKDSLLSLNYTRYDPILNAGPDFIYLNSIIQPAILNPVLGTAYERLRPMTQAEHPTYRNLDAPFFDQNIPFSYAAYNQGGEIDDAQIKILLGRSFANGWKLSFQYDRTYQSGQRNAYPGATGERIYLGGSLAYIPDSSRHRLFASMVLRSKGFFNQGGYTFASNDTLEVPEDPFLAEANLTTALRTEGKDQRFRYLHRYFLKRQPDATPKGLAVALDMSYTKRTLRTSTTFGTGGLIADSAYYGIYSLDDRGLRYELSSTSVLAEADIEYYVSPDGDLPVAFNFRAGIYGGTQKFEAIYEDDPRSQFLLGINGQLEGTVLDRFTLTAQADIPIGERVGEGRVDGSLSWTIAQKLKLSGDILLERSKAPLAAEILGVNSVFLQRTNLSVSTHSQLGGSAYYSPLKLQVKGYLDVYADAVIYGENGIPETNTAEIAIPTLSYSLPVEVGPFTLSNRGVIRNPVQSQAVRLPAYTGQHSLFGKTKVFKNNMTLMAGVDSWMRSPTRRYGYFPLTSVFYLDQEADQADWQFSLDFFLAFKVQSFKAFVRLDRIVVSDDQDLPATVEGFPIARAEGLIPSGSILRLGVSFFLFD
ncbi:MAG: putative porin [Saprospiraceae bacterium]